jgi:multiple sugar transport system permease protein
MRQRQQLVRILSYVFLTVSSFIMIYPVLFMVLGAFTTREQFVKAIILPIPNTLNVELFQHAFRSGIWDAYLFTLIRTTFYIAVTVGVGLIGGYIFSKLNFPGKNKVFLLFLSGMVMPAILMLVPQYLMMAWWPNVGGNNWLGQGGQGFIGDVRVLFIWGWVPPFAIFVLKQSFDMLPTEYEDAAKMDGAGLFTIIFQVYGPLLKPPIVALTILTFLGIWGDYLWPSYTVAGHPEYYPIALQMKNLLVAEMSSGTQINYPSVLIKTFLATWPPAAVYFLLQRYFVQGLVGSGLKG